VNEVSSQFVADRSKSFNAVLLKSQQPDLAIMSEIEYKDQIRLKNTDSAEYISYLKANYRQDAPYGGVKLFTKLPAQGLAFTDAPPDMLYVSPVTLVFRRTARAHPAFNL